MDARPLRSASGMGGKETSGSAVPPPRAPRPPRAPVPHSFLLQTRLREQRSLVDVIRDSPLLWRVRTDAVLRLHVFDCLLVAGVVFVLGLAAYLFVRG